MSAQTTAQTTAIARCMHCNVLFPAPIELPMAQGLLLACESCADLLDNWSEHIEFTENRHCECGHGLDDHEHMDIKSTDPAPCEDCGCRGFTERES